MGLLQLKQLGKLPGTLNDTVGGVIELRDWYFTARRTSAQVAFGFPGQVLSVTGGVLTGSTNFHAFQSAAPVANLVVPQNVLMYVEQYSAAGNFAAAADSVQYACAINNTLQTENIILGQKFTDVVSARVRSHAANSDRGFWMFPGDIPGVFVYDVVAATNVPFILSARITVLPI